MSVTSLILEACVDSAADAIRAEAGGADRVELCAGLVAGGLTPGPGTLAVARSRLSIPIMSMVRPRPGDFLYDATEFAVMEAEVDAAKAAGVDGVVFGLLNADGTVDRARTARLAARARPLEVTFHRAFDMTVDPHAALETLVDLGVDRVLTSGQAATVPAGLDLLRALIERARDRIVVMPGCGLRAHNVRQVIEMTGARELHFTAERRSESAMTHRNDDCFMGATEVPGEYERRQTDHDRVRHFVATARRGA